MAKQKYFPRQRVKQRLEETFAKQDSLQQYLSHGLSGLPEKLYEASESDLVDLQAALTDAMDAVQKAQQLGEQGREKINAVAGHLSEHTTIANELVKMFGSVKDGLTVIINESEFFKNDEETILLVLMIVDPDTFRTAFANLPVNRQCELVDLK